MTTHHWSTLEVQDYAGRPVTDAAEVRRALAQLRWRGSMTDYFLAPVGEPHEVPEDPSTWGPAESEIDWTGLEVPAVSGYLLCSTCGNTPIIESMSQ